MSLTYTLNDIKGVNVLLYIINKLKQSNPEVDMHKVFKVLYFAEQKHITTYGRPIVGDNFIAMENGPVPSSLYDFIKVVRGDNKTSFFENPKKYIKVTKGYFLETLQDADIDELSKSDIKCLDASIEENAQLDFNELTIKSHGSAWTKIYSVTPNAFIPYEDIINEKDTTSGMNDYIALKVENQTFVNNLFK